MLEQNSQRGVAVIDLFDVLHCVDIVANYQHAVNPVKFALNILKPTEMHPSPKKNVKIICFI